MVGFAVPASLRGPPAVVICVRKGRGNEDARKRRKETGRKGRDGTRKVKTDRKRREDKDKEEERKSKAKRKEEERKERQRAIKKGKEEEKRGKESICCCALLFEQMVIAKVSLRKSLISLLASVVQKYLLHTKILQPKNIALDEKRARDPL